MANKLEDGKRFKIAQIAILAAGLIPLLCGCEITNYDELLAKQELKKLSAENEELKQQVGRLQGEIGTLEQTSQQIANNVAAESAVMIDQSALAAELEKLGVFVSGDATGSQITELDFSDANYDNAVLARIAPLPALKKLILNGNRADIETFETIGQIRNLEVLEIPMSPMTPEALTALSGLKKLRYLQIFRSDVTDEGFKILARMPNLQQIRCAQTRISNEALRHISDSNSITALDLSDCNQISDQGLVHLPKLKNLKFLKIWGQGISDEGMQSIGQLTNLNVLGLNDTRVTDKGISQLARLKKLREIHLFRTAVGDRGVEVLSSLPEMRFLNLRDTKISDDSTIYLSRLENLIKLDLSETNSPGITDVSAGFFARMKKLESINLWTTKVTDETVTQLATLPELKQLNLDKTNISNMSVSQLPNMPKLSWLHVGSTEVNDDCVESLLAIPNLKYLNVSNSQISGEKFFELFEKLSINGCEVKGP